MESEIEADALQGLYGSYIKTANRFKMQIAEATRGSCFKPSIAIWKLLQTERTVPACAQKVKKCYMQGHQQQVLNLAYTLRIPAIHVGPCLPKTTFPPAPFPLA